MRMITHEQNSQNSQSAIIFDSMNEKSKCEILSKVADSLPYHLCYLNADEVFLYANKEAEKFWLKNHEGLLGFSIRELTGAFYPELEPYLQRVREGEVVVHTHTFTNEDGSIGHFKNTYTPDFNSDGDYIGFTALGVEITHEIEIEDTLKETEIRFKLLADSMPQVVWTATPDGYVDFYNSRWYEFTGFEPGSTGNEKWIEIVHPDDVSNLKKVWSKALATGKPYKNEFRVREASTGEYRWWLSRARPVKNSNGQIIKWYGSNTDVDEMRSLAENLLHEKVLRENFVSALTHDLRTPLTAAKLNAHLLARNIKNPDKVQTLSQKIMDSMERADGMIQDLLDVNKISAGGKLPLTLKVCDVSSVTKKCVEELNHLNGDRFTLKSNEELKGCLDENAYRRVLENLASNALKYGDEKKDISICLVNIENGFELKVHNFGTAIPEQLQRKIFNPFERIHEEKKGAPKGWGIGLSLVEGIAHAHGGKASVSSNETEGTTFTVQFFWQGH